MYFIPEVSTSTYDGYIPSNFGDPVDMFPADTADTTTITGLSGAWEMVRRRAWPPTARSTAFLIQRSSVLIIDPVTNTANTTTITGLSGAGKWVGGVLAPNGKIYGIPYRVIHLS